MEPATSGIDEMWDDLQRGIEQLYLDREHLTKARFMSLFIRAKNLIDAIRLLDRTPGHHVTGYDLYKYVEAFLRNHVTTVFDAVNGLTKEDLLRSYSSHWERFKCSSKGLNHLLPLVKLEYLRKGWPEGVRKVYGTYELALVTWRDMLLSASGSEVIDGVLALIEDERRGEAVDISLIRTVVSSYVELRLIDEGPIYESPKMEVYKTALESQLLENTKRFYERLGVELFEQNAVSEFVKKVDLILSEEERRAERYLHASTLAPLVRTLWEVLIENHSDVLYAEFQDMLSEDRRDDLASMYQLMSRTWIARYELEVIFGEHVSAQGLLVVERLGDTASNDPMLYVDALMQVYRKYNDIVLTVFANDPEFVHCFDIACAKFINTSAATLFSKSTRKTPEFFAEYCDTVLRECSKAPHDLQLDSTLDGLITLLKYIEDKDAFQMCYTQRLAKRIAQQLSISEVMEGSLMYKLRTACRCRYFSTLEEMFNDMEASKGVNEKFMEHMKTSEESFKIDFSFHVLAFGLWPFKQSSEVQLPLELERIVQCCTTFYSGLHSTRKLQWLHNLSKGELETSCFKKDYTLQASTFQMAVLLQYNDGLSFTVLQLQQRTGMDMGILQHVIESLLKSELLICREDESKDCGRLRPGTVVSLFEGYNNKELLVNISEPIKEDVAAQQGMTQKMIDDHNMMLVQAAAVRVMKVRKTLKHDELTTEIVSRLQPKFNPTVSLIDECLNKLVQKEYLEKDNGQPNTYKYLP